MLLNLRTHCRNSPALARRLALFPCFPLALAAGVCLALSGPASAEEEAELPPVLINEIMYDPAAALGEDNDYEWVELYNTTSSAIDLHGWTLNNAPLSALLPAHSYLIVARQDISDPDRDQAFFSAYYNPGNGYFAITAVADMKNISLGLEGDEFEIALRDPFGDEIDEAQFYPPPGGHGDGTALERIFTQPGAENSRFLPSLDPLRNGGPAEQSSRSPFRVEVSLLTPNPNCGDSLIALETLTNDSSQEFTVTLQRHACFASGPTLPVGPPEGIHLPPATQLTQRRAYYIPEQCPPGDAHYRVAFGPGCGRSVGSVFDEFIVATGDEGIRR